MFSFEDIISLKLDRKGAALQAAHVSLVTA